MKNQYQKKGFLIYWQTETVEELNYLMGHFKSFDEKDRDGSWKYDEFQKISVAMPNEQKEHPDDVSMEQTSSSPSLKIIEPKAAVASPLMACFAQSNTIQPEEQVQIPFKSLTKVFTEVDTLTMKNNAHSYEAEKKKP